ncbi:hypothetical protein CGLAU_07670 [Corynebacterium glaucum]|mgnify:CR=1 FL=1|uniref:Copper oxidase n=1 Tax=Corynebacterium glaucum TaxID=187491 RepID=A0A1Q2HXC8_9CORY|nr:copper oxidase [Corynebacterium glaucum]AQQ15489.1 hypothetical protein CGLAU_07670 [Corynebacterium glaucum]WJZ07991.1 hypothetical protein CGLAUT_07550 [Corynebacterium glaucum]
MPERAAASGREAQRWNPRVWHRKVSRPVTVWIGVFLAVGLAHPLIPESRWLLVHIFTLGILTNSITVWSQNLTERFLHRRLDDDARPAQLLRSRLLNLGILVVLAGQIIRPVFERHWQITACGAVVVCAAVAWHGLVIFRQLQAAGKAQRFRPVVGGYVASAVFLVIGAIFGIALAIDLPGQWQNRILVAHLLCNLGGFVGLAAASSLTVLFSAMWRVNRTLDRPGTMLGAACLGIVIGVAGALAGNKIAVGAGVLCYAGAWAFALQTWVAAVLGTVGERKQRATYWSLSALAAVVWLVAAAVWLGVRILSADEFGFPGSAPVLPLLVGFAAQLLFGTMSYLLPTTMGGGPAATRAGLSELNRGGILRVVLFNVALSCWLVVPSSIAKIAFSVVVFGCLTAFLPLIGRGVRAQRAVIAAR